MTTRAWWLRMVLVAMAMSGAKIGGLAAQPHAAGQLALTYAGAPATTLTQVWNYTLLPGGILIDDCPVCVPPTIPRPMRGTFQLRLVGEDPLFAHYAVEQIALTAGSPADRFYKLTGKGTYSVGGEVALVQEMFLELVIDNGFTNKLCYFTNRAPTIDRLWPMLEIGLDQTNGTEIQTYHLDFSAAPFREIWFSTTHGFHAGIWESPTNYVSPGDLVSAAGRVVKRNQELTAHLGLMPSPTQPDLGLDAVDVLPGGEIAFSIETDAFSESLGPLADGDVLSDRGRVVRGYADLIGAFGPEPPVVDQGLDALQVMSADELYFSVKNSFFSERLGRTIGSGDLLSSRGAVVKTNKELLARFQPAEPGKDYGLDAIFVWPSGEVWFSVETGFYGQHFESYLPGDLLSDQGYVVYRNLDLMSAFQPLEDLYDFGLDAMFVFSDAVSPPLPASIAGFEVNRSTGSLTFRTPTSDGLFQLERAASVLGPWAPLGPVSPGSVLQDNSALTTWPQAFYRLCQW